MLHLNYIIIIPYISDDGRINSDGIFIQFNLSGINEQITDEVENLFFDMLLSEVNNITVNPRLN